jgi:hypothetical protein
MTCQLIAAHLCLLFDLRSLESFQQSLAVVSIVSRGDDLIHKLQMKSAGEHETEMKTINFFVPIVSFVSTTIPTELSDTQIDASKKLIKVKLKFLTFERDRVNFQVDSNDILNLK